jgi:phosphate transport system substrate-binding protein
MQNFMSNILGASMKRFVPAALAALMLLSACGGDGTARRADVARSAPPAGAVALTGAGETFPNPISAKWFDAYARQTGVKINYQSIGSGGGIRQFTEGTVDFGATDGPMSDQQIAAVAGNVAHIPTVLGADVVTYNLPGIGQTRLKLDGTAIADIFLGRITRWNDARIAASNPGVSLPAQDIIVAHRSDGSGTTFIFTDYLSKVSPEWKQAVGAGTSVDWPTGLGGKGNEGVTQLVKQNRGTIGYVELIYAISNGLPYADVKNSAGRFVQPSLASVTAAASGADLKPGTDFRVSITDPAGEAAYPIASFTWLLVKPSNPDSTKAAEIKAFLSWMISPEAQRMAEELHYAPLPTTVAKLVRQRVGRM